MGNKLAVLGECMLEINLLSGDKATNGNRLPAGLSFGGDTLNTALYLARQDFPVEYVTALGDDHLSDWMLAQWQHERIGCALVRRHKDSAPGLYLIETDEHGERRFLYWRDKSPARRLLDNPAEAQALFDQLKTFPALYLSGITLAIFSPYARECLLNFLGDFRRAGGKVIFDGNYRPKLWGAESLTQQAYQRIYRLTDIALPTLEDEQQLFGDSNADAVIDRLQSFGVREIVLKKGAAGCEIVAASGREQVACERVVPVDTTAAGDAFNAGYLARRLSGGTTLESAQNGNRLAAVVIRHKGAIIPVSAMRDFEESSGMQEAG
ncbi:sugar kinase [Microbulbifer thermotolerans]|uniref:2-dehydro-3-deoxygluconokinase n=1 Tax=Microbulbifer thermotolerans TaxID=252514 RepID=A0A143HIZ7_MICTH|nr:sugar kinase [Microbulbifer thermotolerans]AMX01242.1 ketodeoxygluconokinase [Microbulbifer thermotolerans]MCX2778432.1 sugar kinase [Microbulbifer thermotolerans]MCX2783903.1 sugar kinase [Microbulbifer thermotolerans]MCX2802508.1 sugar kinase [Microbulbifer thermotolerans]MCX2805599.1 sugar kinase [Microbulbifer thermotolerans]